MIDLERHVFDADPVVAVGAVVCRPQAEALPAVLEVDDLFGATVGREPVLLLQAERFQ
jgi:hypothetical protein